MPQYPGATLDLAPPHKQGYPVYPSPQQKEGFVLHSMVGSYAAARGRLMGPDEASWQFSVLKDGSVRQHFLDLRTVAWHCGGPGDADPASAAVGNVALIGIEHEGGPIGNVSEPLTPLQLAATIELQRWCYTQLPELKAPALHSSHWEHRWLSATVCPSNRIPWGIIIPALEDNNVTQDEFNQMAEKWVSLVTGATGDNLGAVFNRIIAADKKLTDNLAAHVTAPHGLTGLKRGDSVQLQ